MAGTSNTELVREFWQKVLDQGDTSLIASMLSPSYTFNGQAQTATEVATWIQSIHKELPDLHFTIDDLFGDGDKVAIRWTLLGTEAGTKKRITTTATNVITIAGGLAVSNWQNPANPQPTPVGG